MKKINYIMKLINNTCHICSKTCINKVRDHCHETGNYRGPACKMCNLRYKQQNFIRVIFTMALAMTSTYYTVNSLSRIMIKEK